MSNRSYEIGMVGLGELELPALCFMTAVGYFVIAVRGCPPT
jgi:hypothetical protein